jgi:hypothetical protein
MSIQRFLLIVAAVTSISAPLAHAQEQSGPLGTPGMPHFIHSSGGASNRPAASLASTENLEITTPLPGLPTTYKIRFREFMKYLQESNINLAAQRFNIPIAQAQLTAARVYPDPTFESG